MDPPLDAGESHVTRIGIVEANSGDFSRIERQLRGELQEPLASFPAGWRAVHHHGHFGRTPVEGVWLATVLQRLAAREPRPERVVLEPGALESLPASNFPFEIVTTPETPVSGWLPLVPARQASAYPAEEQFERLASTWKRETARVSSLSRVIDHPAYQAIIRMGPEVVPWILRDLRLAPRLWGPALEQITGENPVPEEDRSKPRESAAHWLHWGDTHGKALRA